MSTELKKNALLKAENLASLIGRPFSNQDVSEYAAKGVDLRLASICYIETYTGKSPFLIKMRDKAVSGTLTDGMVRALMNSMREALMGIKRGNRDALTITPPELRKYNCYTCRKEIVGLDVLRQHKADHTEGRIDKQGNPLEAIPVIEDRISTLNLDLSMLPDGRYAAPEFTGKNDLTFLMVKRVRKSGWRNRLFVYGKRIRGSEWVEAGTIEVKEWSSDSKRLCGEQKHGEVYKGEFEAGLEIILRSPETWAKLFGLQVGRCYRCGKTLTDEDSRAAGIGPECVKVSNHFTTTPTTYRTT